MEPIFRNIPRLPEWECLFLEYDYISIAQEENVYLSKEIMHRRRKYEYPFLEYDYFPIHQVENYF